MAYNGETLVDSASFEEGCTERTSDHYHIAGPITKLVITPPQPMPSTGAQFFIHYYTPCPPTGDPVLDDPVNRDKMDSTFQASDPGAAQVNRREHIRAAYRYPDGHVESHDLNPPGAANCYINNLFIPTQLPDGGVLAWLMHSHPFTPWELVTQCGNVVYAKPKPYFPGPSSQSTAAGGGGDWQTFDAVNNQLYLDGHPQVRMYVFDKTSVYTMLPNPIGQSPTDTYTTIDRDIASCGA